MLIVSSVIQLVKTNSLIWMESKWSHAYKIMLGLHIFKVNLLLIELNITVLISIRLHVLTINISAPKMQLFLKINNVSMTQAFISLYYNSSRNDKKEKFGPFPNTNYTLRLLFKYGVPTTYTWLVKMGLRRRQIFGTVPRHHSALVQGYLTRWELEQMGSHRWTGWKIIGWIDGAGKRDNSFDHKEGKK